MSLRESLALLLRVDPPEDRSIAPFADEPKYMIQHVTEHRWAVQKLTYFASSREWGYNSLHPAGSNCTSEEEALDWMMADALGVRPLERGIRMEPYIGTTKYYNADGTEAAE